jgi:hypothetical protein
MLKSLFATRSRQHLRNIHGSNRCTCTPLNTALLARCGGQHAVKSLLVNNHTIRPAPAQHAQQMRTATAESTLVIGCNGCSRPGMCFDNAACHPTADEQHCDFHAACPLLSHLHAAVAHAHGHQHLIALLSGRSLPIGSLLCFVMALVTISCAALLVHGPYSG